MSRWLHSLMYRTLVLDVPKIVDMSTQKIGLRGHIPSRSRRERRQSSVAQVSQPSVPKSKLTAQNRWRSSARGQRGRRGLSVFTTGRSIVNTHCSAETQLWSPLPPSDARYRQRAGQARCPNSALLHGIQRAIASRALSGGGTIV